MFRITILYPNAPGAKFDHAYYTSKHTELVRDRLTPHGLVDFTVDKGVGTMQPGTPAPYVAVATMTFKTLQGFQESFAKHGADLMSDGPNYTNITDFQVNISEVVL